MEGLEAKFESESGDLERRMSMEVGGVLWKEKI